MWVEISRHAHALRFLFQCEREEEFSPPIPSHQLPRFNVSTGFMFPLLGRKISRQLLGEKSQGRKVRAQTAMEIQQFGAILVAHVCGESQTFKICSIHVSIIYYYHMNMLHVYMHDPIRSYGVLECKLISNRSPNSRKLIRLISVASLEAYMYLNCMYTYTYVHLL